MRRYQEALSASKVSSLADSDDDCIVLDDLQSQACSRLVESDKHAVAQNDDQITLFYKARLKRCKDSIFCRAGECREDHNFELAIEGFTRFTLPLDIGCSSKSPEKLGILKEIEDPEISITEETKIQQSRNTPTEGPEETNQIISEIVTNDLEAPGISSESSCS